MEPKEHRKDRRHGSEPQWVEITFGHIVLRFLKAIRGVTEKKPRKNLDPKKFRGRSATYIHSLNSYNECCEMARRILCPELYKSWVDDIEDHPVVEQIIIPPPEPKPAPEPPKGPEQGELF